MMHVVRRYANPETLLMDDATGFCTGPGRASDRGKEGNMISIINYQGPANSLRAPKNPLSANRAPGMRDNPGRIAREA